MDTINVEGVEYVKRDDGTLVPVDSDITLTLTREEISAIYTIIMTACGDVSEFFSVLLRGQFMTIPYSRYENVLYSVLDALAAAGAEYYEDWITPLTPSEYGRLY